MYVEKVVDNVVKLLLSAGIWMCAGDGGTFYQYSGAVNKRGKK
jgi:hypothetical protein